MRKTINFIPFTFFSLILLGQSIPTPGHEGRGGNPNVDRFRRIGRFLVYHLSEKQVRLSTRLKNFETFKSTVKAVPIKLVEDFPKEFKEKLKQELVGMTIDDPTSPTKKTILLHEKRFIEALQQFDDGKETKVFVVGDPKLLVTVKEQTNPLKEASFLSFCFHEFLLASQEEDTTMAISTELIATREGLSDWNSYYGGLKDRTLSLDLPPFFGKEVAATEDLKKDSDNALDSFIEGYSKEGKLAENHFIESIKKALGEKAPVIKFKVTGEKLPSETTLSFASGNYVETAPKDWNFSSKRAAVFYTSKKSVLYYLDSDERIDSQSFLGQEKSKFAGEAFSYWEFEGAGSHLKMDKKSLIEAHRNALESFSNVWEKQKLSIEQKYKKLYGEHFLFVTLSRPSLEVIEGESKQFRHRTFNYYLSNGPEKVSFRYVAYPMVYFIREP